MAPAAQALYEAYKGDVQFLLIYIREAHPSRSEDPADKPRIRKPPGKDLDIAQPRTMDERLLAADKCMKGLKLTLPTLLDDMDNPFLKAYGGSPAGTAVVDIDGKIAYWTPGRPDGCKPKDAEAVLKKLLAAGGEAVPAKWADVKLPRDAPPGPAAATNGDSGQASKRPG